MRCKDATGYLQTDNNDIENEERSLTLGRKTYFSSVFIMVQSVSLALGSVNLFF